MDVSEKRHKIEKRREYQQGYNEEKRDVILFTVACGISSLACACSLVATVAGILSGTLTLCMPVISLIFGVPAKRQSADSIKSIIRLTVLNIKIGTLTTEIEEYYTQLGKRKCLKK